MADHDLNVVTQDQIDIFVARGILIESEGPTWLYSPAAKSYMIDQY